MNEQTLKLMHAVLDREATPGEVRELERVLAADLQAQDRFRELQLFFDRLQKVPEADPPADLVDRVMGRLAEGGGRFSQPSGASGVSSSITHPSGVPAPRKTTFKGDSAMAHDKRNIFIGLGVTAVAVVLIAQYVTDYPASGDQTSG